MTTLPALETLHIFVFLCFVITSGTRTASQPARATSRSPKTLAHVSSQEEYVRPELPAHAKLAPHEGHARYLAYPDLDVKIGVARPKMVEMGA